VRLAATIFYSWVEKIEYAEIIVRNPPIKFGVDPLVAREIPGYRIHLFQDLDGVELEPADFDGLGMAFYAEMASTQTGLYPCRYTKRSTNLTLHGMTCPMGGGAMASPRCGRCRGYGKAINVSMTLPLA
jgi:hypothetical protein